MISRPLAHRRQILGLLAGTVIASGLTRAGAALSADLGLATAGDATLAIEYDSRRYGFFYSMHGDTPACVCGVRGSFSMVIIHT